MRRTAIYAHAHNQTCDWCGCELPRSRFESTSGGAHKRRTIASASDGSIVKFVSPIDGNYVRARLCPTHKAKLANLCETGR